MYLSLVKLLFVACAVVSPVVLGKRDIQMLEGRYNGEKYEDPYAHMKYSSDVIAEAHSSRTGNMQQLALPQTDVASVPQARKVTGGSPGSEEGRGLPYFNLLQQLGMALHQRLLTMNEQKQQAGARALSDQNAEDDEKETEDLHYHFYPHNQHLFNLPDCATQQVCNAVYKRLNFTQPLCACPAPGDPCSASTLSNDDRTIELKMGGPETKAVTLIKTCEPVWSVRECRVPRDWSILALQNTRTGKAHYLVICKCPDSADLEGPLNHDQPSYAQVPGIRVYGMMCIRKAGSRGGRQIRDSEDLQFPWSRVSEALSNKDIVNDLLDERQTQHN